MALSLSTISPALEAPAKTEATSEEIVFVHEMIVTGPLLRPLTSDSGFSVTILDPEEIDALPALRLDDKLRQLPGFSLFRRQSSLAANPTIQGVTLRGIGPNGAGRALVTLDGVPLNDPFGGWVYWSAIDPGGLGEVRLVRGGGAGEFGNQALTGVLALESRRIEDGLSGSVHYGSFDTVEARSRAGWSGDAQAVGISGHYFRSDGFGVLRADQAGPVDIPAASEVFSVRARGQTRIGDWGTATLSIGYFEEDRENGLPLATNATEAFDASVRLVLDGAIEGEITAYYQTREFENNFTAVFDDARTIFRQVLNQFDVPGEGGGAKAVFRFDLLGGTLETGTDFRYAAGGTNENFRNLGDGFTRLRQAGGDQLFAGAWLEYATSLPADIDLNAGVRLDHWRVFDGFRQESDLADGAVLLDLDFAPQRDVAINGRLGARWQATGAVTLRAVGYTGFRVPTINEFFRPFRVGNDITEANAALSEERLYGLEAGIAYEPLNSLAVSVDYFRNWLEDGVGNVTQGFGPGLFPVAGFVPAGGSLRQRQNIDLIVADGVELMGRLTLADGLALEGRYRFTNARITDFAAEPDLIGNRVAQSPKHSLSFSLQKQFGQRLELALFGRYFGDQFDDDLNSRVLDGFFQADITAAYRLTDKLSVRFTAQNLTDAEIQTALSADGLVSVGPPRRFSGEISARF